MLIHAGRASVRIDRQSGQPHGILRPYQTRTPNGRVSEERVAKSLNGDGVIILHHCEQFGIVPVGVPAGSGRGPEPTLQSTRIGISRQGE
jgi:hypothetical protein